MTADPLSLFLEHRDLARDYARRLSYRLPRRFRLDELEAAALWGVWQAAQTYREGLSTSFRTWAYLPIRWEVTHWLNLQYGNPRCSRKRLILRAPNRPAWQLREGRMPGRAPVAAPGQVQEARNAVEVALRPLGERDRRAVLLYYRDGLNYREIGRRMGLSRQTARSLVLGALDRMRERLVAAGLDAGDC